MSSPLPCIWTMFKCSRGIASKGMIFTFVLPLIDNNDDDNFASWLSCPTKKRQFDNDYDDIFDNVVADDLVRSNN